MRRRIELKSIFSVFILLLLANFQEVFAQNFLVEEDLKLDWVFYDDGEEVMLPFLENSSETPAAIHLTIDKDFGTEAYLMVEIPKNTSLFIEDKFLNNFEEESVKYFWIDSLRSALEIDTFHLTLFNKNKFSNPTEAKIGFLHNSFDSSLSVNPINERNLDTKSDYIKIVLLIIFTLFVILYTLFPSDLLDFLSLGTLFTFKYTDTGMNKYRSLTNTQTLVIAYQGALLATLIVIFINYYNNPFGMIFFMRINIILSWLIVFGVVLLLMFFKYVLISIVSILFGIADKINFYFVEFTRMSMIFYSVLFLVVGYAVINKFYLLDALLNSLAIVVILFNLVRLIILFFKFRRSVPIKNMHLFSYLCTTELIPIIFGLNFFLK